MVASTANKSQISTLYIHVFKLYYYINFFQSDLVKLEDDTYNKHKKDKVKVRVYYEALCPDSKFFFAKHLGPVTEKLLDFLDITLIPYGKAQVS